MGNLLSMVGMVGKDTILVTGGFGKLGTELVPILSQTSSAVLVPKHAELDVKNTQAIIDFCKKNSITQILHLAAISDQKWADQHKPESYETNVIGTRNVANAAKILNIKITYISTDYIFDGIVGGYKEEDAPKPANWYGFTKYAGELEVQNSGAEYCIIRTSFRPKTWAFPTAFTNVITSADYVDVIAKEISYCIQSKLTGIIHIGTPKKSFHDLAKQRNPQVKEEINNDGTFPKNRFLNIDKWLAIKQSKIKNIEKGAIK